MDYCFGPGCDDDDKYSDFDAWWDPYFCCDQFFTNTPAFEVHKLTFHGVRNAGGRGGGYGGYGGNGGNGNKGKSNAMRNAPPMTYDDFSDSSSEEELSDDDVCCDHGGWACISNYSNMLMLGHLSGRFHDDGVPFKCRPCVGSCDDPEDRMLVEAMDKVLYLSHMAICHGTCGACAYKCRAGQKAAGFWHREEHFSISEVCRYNPKAKDTRGAGAVVELEKQAKETVVHSEERSRFICLYCGHKSACGFDLTHHYAAAHTKCRTCKAQFNAEDALWDHFESSTVHKGKYCRICRMVFSSERGFIDHSVRSHPALRSHPTLKNSQVEGPYACEACKVQKYLPTEDDLDAHLHSEHNRCFPCKREFREKKFLYSHLRDSKQHNFCSLCESDFESVSILRTHECLGKALPKEIENVHTAMEDITNGVIRASITTKDAVTKQRTGFRVGAPQSRRTAPATGFRVGAPQLRRTAPAPRRTAPPSRRTAPPSWRTAPPMIIDDFSDSDDSSDEDSFDEDSLRDDYEQQFLDTQTNCDAVQAPMTNLCAGCGNASTSLKVCSRCKSAKYCTQKCQASDWKSHKQTCKPVGGDLEWSKLFSRT